MKKYGIVLIALFVLLAVVPASAQMRFGFTAGLSLANTSSDELADAIATANNATTELSSRVGFAVGGVVAFPLSENVGLHLQPMYVQKGTKVTINALNVEDKVTISYLEVPAMVKMMFGASETRPYVMAGPTLGLKLSASSDEDKLNAKSDDFNSIDFGLAFGGGVSFPAGNNSFFVEARYGLGLSNALNKDTFGNLEAKNKMILINAGMTFPLGQ